MDMTPFFVLVDTLGGSTRDECRLDDGRLDTFGVERRADFFGVDRLADDILPLLQYTGFIFFGNPSGRCHATSKVSR